MLGVVIALTAGLTLAATQPAATQPATSLSGVHELAAWAEDSGRRINLWVIQIPAGAWEWHGQLEHGHAGDQVWTENLWGNVVSSAYVPAGQTSVDTRDWSSSGTFRVCGKGEGRPDVFCSSFARR